MALPSVLYTPFAAPGRLPSHIRPWRLPQVCRSGSCVLQIFLAVDRDSAGENLAKELSRRLGRQKCKLTEWPQDWLAHWVYLGAEQASKLQEQHGAVRSRLACLQVSI
jgi:hypothetical protein